MLATSKGALAASALVLAVAAAGGSVSPAQASSTGPLNTATALTPASPTAASPTAASPTAASAAVRGALTYRPTVTAKNAAGGSSSVTFDWQVPRPARAT